MTQIPESGNSVSEKHRLGIPGHSPKLKTMESIRVLNGKKYPGERLRMAEDGKSFLYLDVNDGSIGKLFPAIRYISNQGSALACGHAELITH